MTVGQLAYCLPWPRLKRLWWPILILGGLVNPVLRTLAGAIWGPKPLPALLWASILLILHRIDDFERGIMQRDRDRRLHYKIAPASLDKLGALCVAAGLGAGAYLCAIDVIPRVCLLTAPPSTRLRSLRLVTPCHGYGSAAQGWSIFAIGVVFVLVALLMPR